MDPAVGARRIDLKGNTFVGFLKGLGQVKGQAVHDGVLGRLTGELGELARSGTLLSSGWYPAAWYQEMLEAVVAETGEGPQFIQDLSREVTRRDFQTLFRIVRLFLDPTVALQQAVRVNRRYCSGGEIEVLAAERDRVHYRFHTFYDYDELMWRDYVGGVEGVLEGLGAKNIRTRVTQRERDGISVELRFER